MFDVWPEPPEVGEDWLAIVRVLAHHARQRQQRQRLVQGHGRFGDAGLERRAPRFLRLPIFRRLSQLDIPAKAAVHDVHRLAGGRVRPQRTGTFRLGPHELHRFLDREIGRRHVVGQRGGATATTFTYLQEGTEPPDAHSHHLSALDVDIEVEHRIVGLLGSLFDRREETPVLRVPVIELSEKAHPLAFSTRDLVEVFLHLGREAHVHEVAEVLAQQLCHGESREAWHECLALAEHVATPDDCCDRRCVRRWPANAESLELLDQGRLGEPRWRRCFMAFRLHVDEYNVGPLAGDRFADDHLRKNRLPFLQFCRRVVAAFHIRTTKPGKFYCLSTRRQHRRLSVRASDRELHRRAQDASVHHL